MVHGSAPEQRGNTLKGLKDFHLKAGLGLHTSCTRLPARIFYRPLTGWSPAVSCWGDVPGTRHLT